MCIGITGVLNVWPVQGVLKEGSLSTGSEPSIMTFGTEADKALATHKNADHQQVHLRFAHRDTWSALSRNSVLFVKKQCAQPRKLPESRDTLPRSFRDSSDALWKT